jgi:3',5'-cyclic AMP phosphodiesterase CpdA
MRRVRKPRVRHLGASVILFFAALRGRSAPAPPTSTDPVLVGAGDIAACDNDGDERTAKLLDKIEGTVFTLGDNVYPNGTAQQFERCYAPTWGRHKARTRPVPGNHDYRMAGASAYYAYFGAAAGDPKKGYYSYDLGAWHVVVVNSNCGEIPGGCKAGSAQEKWIREDLAAHPTPCSVAMWHHPRFSSGTEHGNDARMVDIWRTLQQGGVDLALGGHEHNYERFAPQDADGKLDPEHGIREFVVGTGGKSLYPYGTPLPTTEVRNNTTYGVLKLTLHPDSYDWEFVPVEGGSFADSGTAKCH